MPEQNTQQPPVKPDANGYVHVELGAPSGSTVTQPLNSSSQFDPTPAVTISPVQPDSQTSQLTQPIDEALQKKQTAEQLTTDALNQVKEHEEKAKAAQEQLQKQVEQAKQKMEIAQKELQEAQAKQQDSKKQLESQNGGATTVAGYKPADLLRVLSKPPQPDYQPPPSPVDKQTQEQNKQIVQDAEKQLKESHKQITEASQQIEQAHKSTQKTQKEEGSILQKITALIKGPSEKDENQSEPKKLSYKAFMILGGVILLLALVTFIFTKSLLAIVIAFAAIIQLGMSQVLKDKMQ